MSDERFVVKSMEDGTGRFIVINTEKGWFIPMDSRRNAEFLRDRFIEVANYENE